MNAVKFIKAMRDLSVSDDDISDLLIFAEESATDKTRLPMTIPPTQQEIELATLTVYHLFAGASSEEHKLLMEMVRKKGK